MGVPVATSTMRMPRVRCPGSDQPRESRLVSEGQDTSRSERPALLLNVMVTSELELQLRAMVMVLLQTGPVPMSDVPVTIEGLADIRYGGPTLVSQSHTVTSEVVTSRPSDCRGPCRGLGFYCSWGLCGNWSTVLPPKVA